MSASTHVGRVGVLALFLGVGAVVGFSHAGAAHADDSAASSPRTPSPHESHVVAEGRAHAAARGTLVARRAAPAAVRSADPEPRPTALQAVALAAAHAGAMAFTPSTSLPPPPGPVNYAVNRAFQVASTVVQAGLNSASEIVGQLLGIAAPPVLPQVGVGNPIIPTSVGTNGLVTGSPDPFITYSDGQYYATYTTWDHIEIRSAPSISLLSIATPTVVFPSAGTQAPTDQSAHIWAPELQLLTDPRDQQQHWYLYYSAESPTSSFYTGHRIYALESQGPTPLGPYASAGTLLDTKTQSLTIDPTVYQAPDGRQYLFFSAYPSAGSTGTENVYVQALLNPTTTAGNPVLVTAPTYPWERRGLIPGGGITEAPEVLVRGATFNLVYSGGTYFLPMGYSLGTLSVPTSANLLNPGTWANAKQPTPLLTSSPATGVWSPGHNSFFTSPDGTQTWIAYHAYSAPFQGLPSFLSTFGFDSAEFRTTRIQPVSFTAGGTPVLGVPSAVTVQVPSPSGDPGSTAQFEGATVTATGALTVPQSSTALVGGAGVRVLLTPSGTAAFTLPTPDGAYHLYLRQLPDAYGGQYSVAVNGGAPVAVDAGALSADLGQVSVSGGSFTLGLSSGGLTIADLDEVILIKV